MLMKKEFRGGAENNEIGLEYEYKQEL